MMPIKNYLLAISIGAALSSSYAAAAPSESKSTKTPEASAPESKDEKILEAVAGMDSTPGLLTLYRKDDKSFAAIPRSLLETPLWVSTNLRTGLAAGMIYPNTLGPSWIARFRLTPSKTLQLVAENNRPLTRDALGTALAAANYSESLLAAWPLKASDKDTLLIDGNALAFNDLGGVSSRLDAALKSNYGFDAANSSIVEVFSSASETIIASKLHFYSGKAPAGQHAQGLADARSAFVESTLSFSRLPEIPMPARELDERVALFHVERLDLDPGARPRQRAAYAARWRLEKSNPEEALSPPKAPIRFEICSQMPARYRRSALEGILMWNKAFEPLGYSNAIQAVQLEDDKAITSGGRKATLCFYAAEDAHLAMGPSKLDPRTGEILEARVIVPEIFPRITRLYYGANLPIDPERSDSSIPDELQAFDFASQTDIAPDDRETLAQDHFRFIVAHEVGHALGLRHNFKASAAYSFETLSKPGFSGDVSSSVMDYLPANIYAGRKPEPGSVYPMRVGPYDIWAIAYAYSSFETPQAEQTGLANLLAQADTRPELALGSDEEASGDGAIDPHTLQYDLSSKPIAFARSRFELADYRIAQLAAKARAGGLDPAETVNSINHLFDTAARATAAFHRFFGGAHINRQGRGAMRASIETIDPQEQREAIELLDQVILSKYIEIPPVLLTHIADVARARGAASPSMDYENRIEEIQSGFIKPFFTPSLTDRIMDATAMYEPTSSKKPPMDLLEIESAVKNIVWKELYAGTPITRTRRNLQRAYSDALCASLKNPANLSTDPRAMFRDFAVELAALSKRESASPKRSAYEKSHLRDISASFLNAIGATVIRDKP